MGRSSILEIPSGVQCFVGEEARLRREVERRLAEVFRWWSYEEIVLPLFDFDDVFTRGGGPSASSSIYRFIGRGGEVMALRPDFTALVAKVVVSRLSRLELPLRLFYSGEVLRYQPPRAGRQEELFQIGLEHFGDGVAADVEVLLVAADGLARLGIDDAVMTIGHVGFALGFLASSGKSERTAALDAMRRHDRDRLREVLGRSASETIGELIGLSGGVEVLEEAERFAASEASRQALSRLREIARLLAELGLGGRIRFDLGEVRGFDYYTGLVFEVHAPGAGLELGGGGRYDSLVGRFGRDVPAVGFYLSLDRIAELLTHKGFAPEEEPPREIRLDDDPGEALRRALEDRHRGRRVRVTRS